MLAGLKWEEVAWRCVWTWEDVRSVSWNEEHIVWFGGLKSIPHINVYGMPGHITQMTMADLGKGIDKPILCQMQNLNQSNLFFAPPIK